MHDLDVSLFDPEIRALLQETGAFISLEFQNFSTSRIDYKSYANPFTYVDVTAEEMLKAGLNRIFPQAAFMGEETATETNNEEWVWIVDPVDGTVNFIHGMPMYCISLALVHHGTPVLGYVYQPETQELWSAQKGSGAFLNHTPISVSRIGELSASLVATGFPYDAVPWPEAYMQVLVDFQKISHGIRRIGSAALDLAFVAAGRCEAYYEYHLKPWDIAAGMLLVQEAGGAISDFSGGPCALYGGQIVASNGLLHKAVLEALHHRIPELLPS